MPYPSKSGGRKSAGFRATYLLRPVAAGRYTVYATNHGGRESVEVFELTLGSGGAGGIPSATWIGCVLLPPKLAANSVAAFSDGTLVATVLILPGKTFEDAFAGRNTGIVLQWTPGTPAFVELKGTELVANNGIDTSPDDREFYVASALRLSVECRDDRRQA